MEAKGKKHWLKDGDTNSKFFHAMASQRKKQNNISILENDVGHTEEEQGRMCNIARNYFINLFKVEVVDYAPIMNLIRPRVSPLIRDFTVSEFKTTLFEMHSDKAQGPDGLNSAFYKKFWHLCGMKVYTVGLS